jgi:hypothetical protein
LKRRLKERANWLRKKLRRKESLIWRWSKNKNLSSKRSMSGKLTTQKSRLKGRV